MSPNTSTRAPVILHSVTPWDTAFLYELACDPEVRAQSLDPHIPTLAEHDAWLTRFLADKSQRGWIVLYQHEKAAFVRLDHNGRLGAKISVAVHPKYRGHGVATAAVYHATLFAQNAGWGVIASVKPENLASRRVFTTCGYVEVGPGREADQDVIVYAKG